MSQPDTPEQPDTESQKTAVPQPEMQPETSSETPSEPQEPAQWQPEKHRFGSIGILAASAIGVVLALYGMPSACRPSAWARFTPTTPMCAAA